MKFSIFCQSFFYFPSIFFTNFSIKSASIENELVSCPPCLLWLSRVSHVYLLSPSGGGGERGEGGQLQPSHTWHQKKTTTNVGLCNLIVKVKRLANTRHNNISCQMHRSRVAHSKDNLDPWWLSRGRRVKVMPMILIWSGTLRARIFVRLHIYKVHICPSGNFIKNLTTGTWTVNTWLPMILFWVFSISPR